MDWLTQNWVSILIVAAIGWMMFGRGGQGGGCCGGAASVREPRKSGEDAAPPGPADSRH